MIICMRISPFYSLLFNPAKCHFEIKWHNETAAVYQFTGIVLPILQPSFCKISMFWASILKFC